MPSQNNNTPLPVIVAGIAAARSRSAAPTQPPAILAVDDNRTQLEWLSAVIGKWGCEVSCAMNGNEALALMQQHPQGYDLVVLDREMPGMNGMELLRFIHADPLISGIPVIMLTGTSESEQLQEEINAGIFYHLLKPVAPELLRTVVIAALRERRQKRLLLDEIGHHNGALQRIATCSMSIKTLTEAEDAACLLAQCFPQPIKAVTGFMELLINAIEHGNLGISYEEKTQLLENGRWHEEIETRLALPQYQNNTVTIVYQHKPGSWVAQITDQGSGFDWRKFWHVDPSHATASHGRGIPRARLMAFDRVTYNEKGNQVTVSSGASEQAGLKW